MVAGDPGPPVVWAHLTTAEGLVRWVGPEATADPAPGGALRWTHPDGATVVGQFLELVPHRGLIFTSMRRLDAPNRMMEAGHRGGPPG